MVQWVLLQNGCNDHHCGYNCFIRGEYESVQEHIYNSYRQVPTTLMLWITIGICLSYSVEKLLLPQINNCSFGLNLMWLYGWTECKITIKYLSTSERFLSVILRTYHGCLMINAICLTLRVCYRWEYVCANAVWWLQPRVINWQFLTCHIMV